MVNDFSNEPKKAENLKSNRQSYKKYYCVICGWIYDEELGSPEDGIAPGTKWEDIPDDFECPDCGAGKSDFDMHEI